MSRSLLFFFFFNFQRKINPNEKKNRNSKLNTTRKKMYAIFLLSCLMSEAPM